MVKEIRLVLRASDDAILYELNAMGVDDVRYDNDKGREALEVIVSPRVQHLLTYPRRRARPRGNSRPPASARKNLPPQTPRTISWVEIENPHETEPG